MQRLIDNLLTPTISFIVSLLKKHYYIHVVNHFQDMIRNGGSMKCGGECENVKLQTGDYFMKKHMFSIGVDVNDIILGAIWLIILGSITIGIL